MVPGAPAGQDRALLRLHGHQLHAGLALAQVAPRAHDGAARAHACAETANPTSTNENFVGKEGPARKHTLPTEKNNWCQ